MQIPLHVQLGRGLRCARLVHDRVNEPRPSRVYGTSNYPTGKGITQALICLEPPVLHTQDEFQEFACKCFISMGELCNPHCGTQEIQLYTTMCVQCRGATKESEHVNR